MDLNSNHSRVWNASNVKYENALKIEEYAILLSKIIICPHVYEENCNKCNIWKRIDENTYGELKIIKPINRIIKKESIIE